MTARHGWYTSPKGNKFYYDANGNKVTGWHKIGGKKYYFRSSGVMQTMWARINGKKYYFGKTGVMRTMWETIGGKKYYFGKTGVMRTGWEKIGNKYYQFRKNGSYRTNVPSDVYKLIKKARAIYPGGIFNNGTYTILRRDGQYYLVTNVDNELETEVDVYNANGTKLFTTSGSVYVTYMNRQYTLFEKDGGDGMYFSFILPYDGKVYYGGTYGNVGYNSSDGFYYYYYYEGSSTYHAISKSTFNSINSTYSKNATDAKGGVIQYFHSGKVTTFGLT